MKKRVIIFFSLVIISFLTGCNRCISQDGISTHVIQAIHIRCESYDTVTERRYTTPEKIRFILLCIRKLGPDFPAQTDVEALEGKTLCITLTRTDGKTTTYQIKNNLYIQKNNSPWRQISLDNATGFYQLITLIPSDAPQSRLRQMPEPSPALRIYSPVLREFRLCKKS